MKNKIIASIIIFTIVCVIVGTITWNSGVVAMGTSPDEKQYTKEELVQMIQDVKYIKDNAHQMAESARILGWKDDDKLIKDLQEKWTICNERQIKYQKMLDNIIAEEERVAQQIELKRKAAEEAKWASKAAEYPAATQIWRYMKAQGWNDYVCAGIMGNLMAEVGSQTLNIQYSITSHDGYYGMCQWSKGYTKVWGANLQGQCDFLRDTIKYEFDTYGFKYQKGFNFNSFLNMTDAQQAALAFAKSYERCASGSYGIRQKNALKAYNYFVS